MSVPVNLVNMAEFAMTLSTLTNATASMALQESNAILVSSH